MKTLVLLLILIDVSISERVYTVVGIPDQNFTVNEYLISRATGSDFDSNTNPGVFVDYNDDNNTYMYVTCYQNEVRNTL